MRWEEMTPKQFEQFFASGGDLCLVPLGSLEKHGQHLPVGNDTLKAYQFCLEAAKQVPAVVMPPFYVTHVGEMCISVGGVTLDNRLLLEYFTAVCDEIGRNGFRRIALVSAHGGNRYWLPALVSDMIGKRKPYLAYHYYVPLISRPEDRALMTTERCDGHGGEAETSIGRYFFDHLIDHDAMKNAPDMTEYQSPVPLGPMMPGWDFAAAWPDLYAGCPRAATVEVGKTLVEGAIEKLVEQLKMITSIDFDKAMALQNKVEDFMEKRVARPLFLKPESK